MTLHLADKSAYEKQRHSAAAEHGATVLHYDQDFDLIAAVTGQPARWIIPRGSGRGAR